MVVSPSSWAACLIQWYVHLEDQSSRIALAKGSHWSSGHPSPTLGTGRLRRQFMRTLVLRGAWARGSPSALHGMNFSHVSSPALLRRTSESEDGFRVVGFLR